LIALENVAGSRRLVALLLSFPLVSCSPVETSDRSAPRLPASILVRAAPASGGRPALREWLAAGDLAREVAAGLEETSYFSDVRLDGEGEGGPRAASDFICEVESSWDGVLVGQSQANGKAYLSSVLWLLLFFPSWWVDDRDYPVDGAVHARLIPHSGAATAGGRSVDPEILPIGDVELDLWRRGASEHFWLSLLVPTFWMEDPHVAHSALHAEALRRVREKLPGILGRAWPANALQAEPGCVLLTETLMDGRFEGWLAARRPIAELRATSDYRGTRANKLLTRLGPKDLVAEKSSSDGWAFMAERLGPSAPRPDWLYRVVLDTPDRDAEGHPGLPFVRMEVRLDGSAATARFTIAP